MNAALSFMRNAGNGQNSSRNNSTHRSHYTPNTYRLSRSNNRDILASTPRYKNYVAYLQNSMHQITLLENEIQCASTKNINGGDELSYIEKLGRKLAALKCDVYNTKIQFKRFITSELEYYSQRYGEDDDEDEDDM